MKNTSLFQNDGGKSYIIPFILVTSLFFMWGLANNMTDTMLAAFKKIMSMSNFETSYIQVAFYGAYFCLALPAAFLIKRFSYKSGILVGLILYAGGCLLFYPASQAMSYDFFLVAYFIAAGGMSFLETSSNPYIITMGPEETATRRLNLAQSFNPLGSITGILLSKFFILSHLNPANADERKNMPVDVLQEIQSKELSYISNTYVLLGVVLVVIFLLILIVKMPKNSNEIPLSGNVFIRLLKNKKYSLGVLTQFFYVGAQIGVWSFTIAYAKDHLKISEDDAGTYYLASIVLFSIFRFIFTALMKIIRPSLLLVYASIAAIIATSITILCGGMIGVISLVCISVFMSLMFPTIYGIALHRLGDDTKIGGSGLIMAILGGAILTAVQGKIYDIGNVNMSYIVPLICFIVVAAYGWWNSKKTSDVKQ
ncbi:MAG: L-fucose:H+ symporter permease [Dysgonamonadaceae bacterium]|jgi:FHS family L-fucose permease-like MFS transporter|nr:L-fucose:H+ symporter permease [Dysgonamonadaceae bacterium]